MAVKKIEIRPKGTGDYADVLYPMTSDDMVQVADANGHFSASTLNGVLDELFQNADNGQRSIANVVGSPTVAGDTYAKISNDIQNQKNTLASNLTNKGQSSTGSETLQSLVNKVANISSGVSAGSSAWATTAVAGNTTATTMTKRKSITVSVGGTYRIDFDLRSGNGSVTAYGQIYKNGVAVGTLRSTASATYVTYSQDISGFKSGDTIELWVKSNGSGISVEYTNLIIRVAGPTVTLDS